MKVVHIQSGEPFHALPVYEVLVSVREEHHSNTLQLTDLEQRQLAAWNATQQNYPLDVCVPQLVARQAAATPGVIALVAGEEKLTYRELNQRANQLARYLQTVGVGPNALVGLCLERSLDMV